MKKKIISLHGSYFGNNYGDILLVKIFEKWIREVSPEATINLPKGNESRAEDLNPEITGYLNLIRSKALVFCGGGYFGEQPTHHNKWAWRNFWRHGIIGILAVIFKIPYVIVGVEFGPISCKWFRNICLFIARHSKQVVVRNVQSLDFLKQHGIENAILSSDAVLTLSDYVKPVENHTSVIRVAFHINSFRCSVDKFNFVLSSLLESLDHNFESYRIDFISDSSFFGYESSQYYPIIDRLKSKNINYSLNEYKNCNALIELINSSDFVITSKLHVGITAAALNKRVLSLWSHNKTPRFHKQIGNEGNCIELSLFDESNAQTILNCFFCCPPYKLPMKNKEIALENKKVVQNFITTTIK